MKKIIILFFWSLILNFTYSINLSWCYKKIFRVSAYYSPIWWQHFYYMWNFWNEVKLNWRWVRWASWKLVFNWMLAWPKKYKFWTKIYFPWLWVWEIEDRWNAIVSAWNRWEHYDRIDVWVWKWDKALMRALSFWKNIRVWYVCPSYKKLKVWFNYNNFPILNNFFQKTLWGVWLFIWRRDYWVKVLQTYLYKLWYLKVRATWYFWPLTKKAVMIFQKNNWIRTKYYWYFWPKTRQKLKNLLKRKWLYNINRKKVDKKPKKNRKKEKIEKKLAILKRWLWKWYNTYEVKILQTYLNKLWYYNSQINWYYGDSTVQAVAKFQIKHDIIPKWEPYLAWYFWPKTRALFKKIVLKKLLNS